MLDRESFIAAIAANPDDDLPRLVFADWLDENGDPERAEFIRTQIRWHHATDEEEKQHLNRRAAELFRDHWQRWLRPFLLALDPHADPGHWYEFRDTGHSAMLAPLAARNTTQGIATPTVTHVHVTRGLVSLFGLILPGWGEAASLPEAFRHEPPFMLQCRLARNFPKWQRFTHPGLRRVEWLTLTELSFPDGPVVDSLGVFDDPHLAGVREFSFSVRRDDTDELLPIPAPVIARFARSPLAYRLNGLHLPNVDEAGVRALYGPEIFRLDRLSLGGELNADCVRLLERNGFGHTVRELRLNDCRLGSGGVEELARGNWRRLTHLELRGNRLMLGGLRRLAEAGFVRQLVTLDLSDNILFRTTPDKVEHGLRMLSEALDPERLEHLNLSNTDLDLVPDFLAERFGDRVTV